MFVVVLVLLIKMTLASVNNRKSVLSIYVKILLNHLHLIILVASFELDWPAQVKAIFDTSKSIADAPSQMLSVDCLLDTSVSSIPRFYVYLLMYFVIPFLITATAYCVWAGCIRPRCGMKKKQDKALASVVILLFLFHPMITTVVF